ncbi:CRISPR-associated helicase Cas3' [Nonomuraea harbinensis]|uniref:CRISPR-associated helicase Cas3 n=1 Tax=Nonomuraea harbinensis TaxID=1286938 RepID=A0ABW1C5Q8_9ACTN|nr:CRISPR-associated helicase Cas3' [Nonomuraea harbinensis]
MLIWGKSRNLPTPYPLICHLLDAAAMASTLWQEYLSPTLQHRIAEALGTTVDAAGRLVAFWAGLHDIGKCMGCFQSMDAAQFGRLNGYPEVGGDRRRHEYAAHVWLGLPFSRMGYGARRPKDIAYLVAQLLGGHHGRFSARDHRECRFKPTEVLPELGDGKWEAQREALFRAVSEVLQPPSAPAALNAEAATLACGIVILADWLVSQDDYLKQRLPQVPIDAGGLRRHYEGSLRSAPSLIAAAGLRPVRLRSASFADEFSFIECPNALQHSVAGQLPTLLTNGLGLLLVTAPMGIGKTEVAFHGARLLGQASDTPGFLFALPTMATADQMYGRARAYGESQAEDDAALTLLHSMAWLNDAYTAEGVDTTVVSEDTSVAAPDWLHGKKRGLLAPMSVGTIDQVLLAVLPLKHMPLRMLGLAGKVLIVDEVHAYDAYMQKLLAKALVWLGRLGVPVVLMSATLPTRIAARLVSSYLEGAGHSEIALPPITYPGWAFADAVTGKISAFEVDIEPSILHVERRPVPVLSSALDRSQVLREVLAPLVDEGGCAGVVCNTVAEAQQTYLFLRDWFDTLPQALELTLLHARFPARRREEITSDITRKFGKCKICQPSDRCGHRPKAVVVATQVIEQSLDLDFDLVISDLAPVALLLQRAGRCQRHAGRLRPAWAAERRLVVLRPGDEKGELVLPRSWPFVYSPSLLRRTDQEITDGEIAIPDDVQRLVEQVYDDSFANGDLSEEDLEWIGKEIAEEGIADMIAIPSPDEVSGLHQLTSSDAQEDLVATRLGADSTRVLCVYQGPDGSLYLDEACTTKLPDTTKLPRQMIKKILAGTIPLRSSMLAGRDSANDPPSSWRDSAWLRDLAVIPLQIGADGSAIGWVGQREFRLHTDLGLQITTHV